MRLIRLVSIIGKAHILTTDMILFYYLIKSDLFFQYFIWQAALWNVGLAHKHLLEAAIQVQHHAMSCLSMLKEKTRMRNVSKL